MLVVQGHTLRSLLRESTQKPPLSSAVSRWYTHSPHCPYRYTVEALFLGYCLQRTLTPQRWRKRGMHFHPPLFSSRKDFFALCHHFSTDRWSFKYKMLARVFISLTPEISSTLLYGHLGMGVVAFLKYISIMPDPCFKDHHWQPPTRQSLHSWCVSFCLAFLRHHHSVTNMLCICLALWHTALSLSGIQTKGMEMGVKIHIL